MADRFSTAEAAPLVATPPSEDFIKLSLHFRIIEEKFSIFKQQEPVSSPKSSWKILDKATADEFIKRVGVTPV